MQEPMSYNEAMAFAAAITWAFCALFAMPMWFESRNPRRAFVLASGPLFTAGTCIAAIGRQAESGGAVGIGGALVLAAVLVFSVEAMRLFANKAGL